MTTSEADESFRGFSESNETTMVLSSAKELAMAKAERDSLLRCVARIEAFAQDPQGGSSEEVIARMRRLEKCWESFQLIVREVRRLGDPVSVEENEALLDVVDERVMLLMGRLKSLAAAESSVKDESVTVKESHGNLKLPRITLPDFSGKYDTWMQFHDMYLVMIHNSRSLSDVEKFYYLKSSLKGDALKVVEAFPTCKASYQAAWNALVNRYANPYLQKKRHANELLYLPKIKKISVSNVNTLIDCFERHTKLLEQLGEEPKSWGVLLVQLLVSKLDDTTQREWERSVEDKDNADYVSLISFLRGQVRILEALGENKTEQKTVQANSIQPKVTVHLAAGASVLKCAICDGDHHISKCNEFISSAVKDRYKIVRAKGLCGNCLTPGHFKVRCMSKVRCRVCNRNHHSLLHSWSPMQSESVASKVDPVGNAVISSVACPETSPSRGRLSTAIVNIATNSGHTVAARAMLDSGSQLNLLSNRLCRKLQLPSRPCNIRLTGVGQCEVECSATVTTVVSSRNSKYSRVMDFVVLENIIGAILPMQPLALRELPANFVAADPDMEKGGEVDVLLGSEFFFEFLCLDGGRPQIVQDNNGNAVFLNTVFGWIATGARKQTTDSAAAFCSQTNLEKQIEKFWSVEEIETASKLTQEEKDCEQHFLQSHARDKEGRYIVQLPFKTGGVQMIGDSKKTAVSRFSQLERRFKREEGLRSEYAKVIQEYLTLEFLAEVEDRADQRSFYLPHHPVVKLSSTSTKVRPVFDGSAKSTSGFSLNDSLMVGPVVQDPLFDLILRFRINSIALVADIEKMYLQVRVHQEHTPFQRILWRFSEDEPVKVYELQRVTFGLGPSSFLATRVLQQLAQDEGESYPHGKRALLEDFYVDDYIGGAGDEAQASLLVKELRELLQKGGFVLKKWISNRPCVLRELPADEKAVPAVVNLGAESQIKALGVCWSPATDELNIAVKISESTDESFTKRKIYSLIAQLFDPLGIIGPIIAWAKIRMQHLWIAKSDWDDPVSDEINQIWSQFQRQLYLIASIRVARHAFVDQSMLLQLHCFCDASESAYGACVYARSVDAEGMVKVELLASKSRPAPLKRVSLARLELCAALIGSRLCDAVVKALKLSSLEVFFWSDSTIVLDWLASPAYNWTTYVANRVAQVQELTKGHKWLHVKGEDNPADDISRGLLPEELVNRTRWFHGPPWLKQPGAVWNGEPREQTSTHMVPERRKMVVMMTSAEIQISLLERFSSYWRSLRVTVYCLRFIRRCQGKVVETGFIKCSEYAEAKRTLIKALQRKEFEEEIRFLSKDRPIPANSKLKRLRPFLDESGILRVGGRLRNADIKYAAKHPMILPGKCHFTRIVAAAYHEMILHGGPQLTLAALRQDFWPLNGRALVNFICRRCHACFKVNPAVVRQPPGQLPEPRTSPARPFSTVGVDYCGPVMLKPPHRKSACQKAYIAIFVCFFSKAVHIEIVEDLSTPAFMACFRRFVSRRGIPVEVYSDNGLNFKGASRELRELYAFLNDDSFQAEVHEDGFKRGITWHFIPPRAPNFGGLWEAAVKSAKRTLSKVLGSRSLSFQEMATVLVQIEAQMNSRPLTPLSDDPRELDVLTPGHFLIGQPLLALPDVDHYEMPSNRLKGYEQLQQLVQHHWRRWRNEYLSEIHNVSQRVPRGERMRIGQMVILKEHEKITNEWYLGRIVDVHPGKDGVVRVVSLKTAKGVYKRPTSKICLLPFEKFHVNE